MKFRKVMAVILAAALTFSMAACGEKPATDGTSTNAPTTNDGGQAGTTTPGTTTPSTTGGTNNEIVIGTWWLQYYDSSAADVYADPAYETNLDEPTDTEEELHTNAVNRQIAQYKFDNVKAIEQKYGVKFYWENLTFEGIRDSINTSILAGSPDCDLYFVDATMGIPAQMNGLAIDLKTILPADHDIFTTQKIATYYDLGDGRACLFAAKSAQNAMEDTYPLGFNVQMLEDANLEDPRVLWERGEWTWDKFIEYCQVLTQDTDGDGQNDQFGFCAFAKDVMQQLMMSNGASIAQGNKEGLSSPETAECLQLLYDMYNTYNVCYPYDLAEGGAPWDTMRRAYREGTVAFSPIAAWILDDGKNYNSGYEDQHLQFDIAFVRWPVGPSGNKDTNAGKNLVPNGCLMIPAGCQEPEKVFNVMYDFWNFTGDVDTTVTIRDDRAALNWWYDSVGLTTEMMEANVAVMKECGSKTVTDLWDGVGIEMDWNSLINGTMTPAQFQETYKQTYQDALDSYLGN